jgi:hypothetical protein
MGEHGGMAAGDYDDAPTVRSWITPKATKGGTSAIAGQGLHAIDVVAGGEVVAVKGGHIVAASVVAGLPDAIRDSAFPIAADCFLAALTYEEYGGVMMRVNHSCEPNVGMGGNVLLVSMRDIAAGEELTIDYALFLGDPGFAMECRCGTAACRGGEGNGLDARGLAGTLPGMVLVVAPAEDHKTRAHQGQCP